MAFTKRSQLINIIPTFDTLGAVTDVQAFMLVTLVENGVDTRLTFASAVSIWAGLTPLQQAQLATIMTRINTVALAVDIPLPLVN